MHYLHQIDPIALSLGPIKIHWYGLMYLLGFGAGWWLGRLRVRAGRLPGVSEQGYADLIFYAMLGVILGGRIGYVLFYGFADFLREPLSIVRVWEGGMSFHGGVLGVLGATLYWSWRNRIAFWDTVDFLAPLVPPGLGFGRLGNWIGGELWGRTTDVPWAVIFPKSLPMSFDSNEALLAAYRAGELAPYARHPSQLYQMLLEGVVMFAVLWWYSSTPRPRYAVAGLFGLLYGSFRFAVEFVRQPDEHLGYLAGGWLTMGMLLSVPLVVTGIVLLAMSRRAPTLAPAAASSTPG